MCINCNLLFPVSDAALECLNLPAPRSGEVILMSTRQMLDLIMSTVGLVKNTTSKDRVFRKLVRALKIGEFYSVPEELSESDMRKLLGLSDFSNVFTIYLKDHNFVNEGQYEVVNRATFSDSLRGAQIHSGNVSSSPSERVVFYE